MTTITLTRHEFSSSELWVLARKERRPWIRRRIKAIAAIAEESLSREAIARQYHTDSDQVRLWLTRYNAEGLAGLKDRPGRGAKRTLTSRQEDSLKKTLQKFPKNAGIATNLWTGRAVQEYLEKRQWFSCSIPEAYVLIHRLGFALQRPGRASVEADPKAEQRFLKELRGKKI
jgi:transposase